jgi:hypothetical protein
MRELTAVQTSFLTRQWFGPSIQDTNNRKIGSNTVLDWVRSRLLLYNKFVIYAVGASIVLTGHSNKIALTPTPKLAFSDILVTYI